MPTFHVDIDVLLPAVLEGIDVGTSCESFAYPDDGAPSIEGQT